MERITIKFYAYGHPNVKATHKSTLEITRDDYLTPKGDCIIAVKAEYAVNDLPSKAKELLKHNDTKVLLKLRVGEFSDVVHAYGSKDLILESKNSMVIRKSTYVDERTLAIKADKAARDINRDLVRLLKDHRRRVLIELVIST